MKPLLTLVFAFLLASLPTHAQFDLSSRRGAGTFTRTPSYDPARSLSDGLSGSTRTSSRSRSLSDGLAPSNRINPSGGLADDLSRNPRKSGYRTTYRNPYRPSAFDDDEPAPGSSHRSYTPKPDTSSRYLTGKITPSRHNDPYADFPSGKLPRSRHLNPESDYPTGKIAPHRPGSRFGERGSFTLRREKRDPLSAYDSRTTAPITAAADTRTPVHPGKTFKKGTVLFTDTHSLPPPKPSRSTKAVGKTYTRGTGHHTTVYLNE